MNYVDFVIVDVDNGKRLYLAPEFSYLKRGERVIVPDMSEPVSVIASNSFKADDKDPTVKMILNTFDFGKLKEVPKLVAKEKIIKFEWSEKEVRKDEE